MSPDVDVTVDEPAVEPEPVIEEAPAPVDSPPTTIPPSEGEVAIELLTSLNIGGEHRAPGDVVTVAQDVADSVTCLGYAKVASA